ncbi:hypothetical protein ACH4VM_35595 [Streptomyces sp. NPDC020792]|uniref:hypothetical protein n=1 Tax=Streptomyces sp. NPDC020792 TaxID=3365089 RepID=UPI003795E972
MKLLPSQLAALRVFVGLAAQLAAPSGVCRAGLHGRPRPRCRLALAREQMESVAYGFWLPG